MHSYQSSLLIHWWNSFSIPCLGCDNPSNCLPFISSPWQWEWILLSRVGFLCPAGHSLSGTHWCSPGQKHCWCSLDRWMEREREIRKSEGQTKLALWIIQHNPWDAARSFWKKKQWTSYVHFSMSWDIDVASAVLYFVSDCYSLTHHLQPVHKLSLLHPFV